MGPSAALIRELSLIDGVRLWVDAPLAPFTTIGTGGKAGVLATVSSSSALITLLGKLHDSASPWVCLGAGSNLAVADGGCSDVVIKLGETFQYVDGIPSNVRPGSGHVILTAGAGSHLARLAAVTAETGLSGLEFACGIPGSVGGGVVMNAGAHGRSLADLVEEVEIASRSGDRWLPSGGLDWGYRYCRLPEGSVVTAARLRLAIGDPAEILERHRGLLRARRATQPRSARTFGSVFKNPPGDSAGRLLDAAGLKGVRQGGAEVSKVHANFLVNVGEATTADVLALMNLMRQAVQRTSGIILEPEVRLLGAVFPWESPPGASPGRSAGDG